MNNAKEGSIEKAKSGKTEILSDAPGSGGARKSLLLLCAGFLTIDLVLYGLYAVKALWPDLFYYHPLEGYAGFLYDFTNPIKYAYHLNLMNFDWSNAPPFLHFFCYLVSLPLRLFTPVEGGAALSWSLAGQVCFFMLAAGMLAAMGASIWRFSKGHLGAGERLLLCVAALASYPMFFAMASGNLSLLAAALVALFLLAYAQKKYVLAAVLLGMAAALKLYPALLGILFLCDKRWKEAFLCGLVGVGLTCFSLAMFQGGFLENLTDWLQKTASYNQMGNMDLRRTMMNNNSLLMLWDIPYYIARGGQVGLEEMAAHNGAAGAVLVCLLGLSCVSCFALRRWQDRVLLLSLWMVGYPYNSGPYNLVMLIAPLALWAAGEQTIRPPMLVMGCLLLMCKTRFAIFATNVRHITLQSALNPLLIAAMMGYLLWLRRAELREGLRAAWGWIRRRRA